MEFNSILIWLRNNWGNLVGLMGVISGVYFYLKSIRVRKPCYFMTSYNIVGGIAGSHPRLKVYFGGYGPAIDRFTVTKILFLNGGRETIRKEDIPRKTPIEFHLNGEGTILDAEVIHRTKEANDASIEVHRIKISNDNEDVIHEKKSIGVAFDYLDEGDGLVIQVFHTGTTKKIFDVKGEIKGAGTPRDLGSMPTALERRIESLKLVLKVAIILMLVGTIYIIKLNVNRPNRVLVAAQIRMNEFITKSIEKLMRSTAIALNETERWSEELKTLLKSTPEGRKYLENIARLKAEHEATIELEIARATNTEYERFREAQTASLQILDDSLVPASAIAMQKSLNIGILISASLLLVSALRNVTRLFYLRKFKRFGKSLEIFEGMS